MLSATQPVPEWSLRIRSLVKDLNLTQAALAERLGVSPATVSRWIQGKIEPTAEGYVSLGNLARLTNGVYFLERAGVDLAGLPDSGLRGAGSSLRANLLDFNIVTDKKVSHRLGGDANAVAIPLLKLAAYGDAVPPRENVSLAEAEVEDVLMAPLSWCAHPEHMVGMRLHGDSMMPVISPKSLLFVDTAQTDRELLKGSIVLVSHRDLGFKAARLQRFGGTDVLISANQKYPPLDVSNASKWKVFGRVLWWVSRDEATPAN